MATSENKMNKNFLFSILIVSILAAAGYLLWHEKSKLSFTATNAGRYTTGIWQNQNGDTIHENKQLPTAINPKNLPIRNPDITTQKNDSIPAYWKIYTNDKIGITFQYPDTWFQYGEDANVIDRSGNIIATKSNFVDSTSHTTFLLVYYFPPKGIEIFRYVVSQFSLSQGWYAKDAKEIEVAGNKAIEAFTIISIDGKEHILNPPMRFIIIDFLDKQQTGEIQLQFKTPLIDHEVQVTNFRKLLSTFRFTN